MLFLKGWAKQPHKASTFCTVCRVDKGERHEHWCYLGKARDTRTRAEHQPGGQTKQD